MKLLRPRWRLAVLLILLVLLSAGGAYFALDEPLPTGQTGAGADAVARQMQSAVDIAAWQQTGAVRWTFAQRRHLWDRRRGLARVQWDNTEVQLDLWHHTGLALRDGTRMEVADELIEAARGYWINDSFWLNPLAKLFDKGTRRELVVQPDGSDGLLVTYTEGGNRPGDAYLWLVGPTGLPRAWKMWVSIIPVGGLETSWDEWIELETGAKVALRHRWSRFTLELKDVEGATSLKELTADNDPLAAIASARN